MSKPKAIPAGPQDIGVSWLNEVLQPHLDGHKVTGCRVDYGNVPAQTSSIIDIFLDYDDPSCTLPARMVAKLASEDPDMTAIATGLDFYRREVGIYQNFPDIGISRPRCFFSKHDPATEGVVLLMEHLAPAESPGWSITQKQVEEACSQLVGFHARWWNSSVVKADTCLIQSHTHEFWKPLVEAAHGAIGKAQDLFGEDANASVRCATLFKEHFDQIMGYIGRRHFTMVHGDYHAKQMFFPTAKGGRFAVIDWQYPFVGQGPWDLMRMLIFGLTSDVRRAQQDRIISDYYEGLKAAGVTEYTPDQLIDDRRLGALVSQTIQMLVIGSADYAPIEAECSALGIDWKDLYFLRGESVLRELDVAEFLESIVK